MFSYLANVNLRSRSLVSSRSLYAIVSPSVCRLSSVCHVRAPYLARGNFRQCCTQVGYINFSNRMTYQPQTGVWLWSRDCFKSLPFAVMQRVARVRQ